MQRPVPFFSRVGVENYKSIAGYDVRLSPLTVLAGPDGRGKSKLLDALAFLARALETTPSTAVEERGGLPGILRRVPTPADSFSAGSEATLLWACRAVTGRYGFEVRAW
jgi:predicted ATPase